MNETETLTQQSRASLTGVAPVLLVRNLTRAAEHYRDCLGFTIRFLNEPATAAIVSRDGCRLLLALLDGGAQPIPNWKLQSKSNNAYFWVDDAEGLYNEVIARGANIDWELYDTPWGAREFGIQDLDGYDIAFGQFPSS